MTSTLDIVDRIFRGWALETPAPHSGYDARAAAVVSAFLATDEPTRGKIRWRIDNALYTADEIMFDAAITSADGYSERRRQADDRGRRFTALASHSVAEAERIGGREPLLIGLGGLALTGGFPDWRDCVPVIADIRRAAMALGADVADLFARTSPFAEGEMRKLLEAG